MEAILGWISIAMCVIVGLFAIWQARTGACPLMSARNFFLLGFCMFQLTSAATSFFAQQYWEVAINTPGFTGAQFLGMCAVFLIIFLSVYQLRWFTFGIAKVIARPLPAPAPVTMLGLAIGFLIAGFVLRFGFRFVPIIGVLMTMTGVTLAVAAACWATWAWSKQFFNPVRAAVALPVILMAFGLAIFESFGRRDLLSAAIACSWGAWHGHFKRVNFSRVAIPFAAIAVGGVLVMAAYTDVRSYEGKQKSFLGQMQELRNANVLRGLSGVFDGQGAAAISMWLIESRPESFDYDTLHSLKYSVLNIVPRELWPNKPGSLGIDMVDQAAVGTNRTDGFSVGPGMMGHIANDNPWLALFIYPALLAGMIRIFDDMVRLQPDNPFIVIAVGVSLGEVVALSRGELGLFVFRTILAVGAAYFGMIGIAKIMQAFGLKYQTSLAGAELTAGQSVSAAVAGDGYSDAPTGGDSPLEQPAGDSGLVGGTDSTDSALRIDQSAGSNAAANAGAPQRVPWGLQGG